MSFRINNRIVPPIQRPEQGLNASGINSGDRFKDVLSQTLQKAEGSIKISSHAGRRLMERNISLNASDMKQLSDAMDRARAKGARDSLILYKDIAFIASIKNRTIITAVDPKNSKEDVFTNIDSAVIIK